MAYSKRQYMMVKTAIIWILVVALLVGAGTIVLNSFTINRFFEKDEFIVYKSDMRQECVITSCEDPPLATTANPEYGRNNQPFFFIPNTLTGDVCNSTFHNDGQWETGNKYQTSSNPNLLGALWESRLKFGIKEDDIFRYYADMSVESIVGEPDYSVDLIHPDGPEHDIRLTFGGYAYYYIDDKTGLCNGQTCVYTTCWFLTKKRAWIAHDSIGTGVGKKGFNFLRGFDIVDPTKVNRYGVEYNRSNGTLSWYINNRLMYQVTNIGFFPTDHQTNDLINTGTGAEFTADPDQAYIGWFAGSGAGGFSAAYRVGGPEVGLEPVSFFTPVQESPPSWDLGSPDGSFERKTQLFVSKAQAEIHKAE